MIRRTSYEIISDHMTAGIRSALLAVPEDKRRSVTEIRLRAGRTVTLVFPDSIRFLSRRGELLTSTAAGDGLQCTADDIRQIVNVLCKYSVHSCAKELHEGWFVIGGGVRVGTAGTFSASGSGGMQNFSSLNFRIAREVPGCAREIYGRFRDGSVLICGGVNSGKTTVLRDLCRFCGERTKVVLIDERNEISGSTGGLPSMDVGEMTDVLVGCERAEGINMAVRTLSPDMIFCDELSTAEDAAAILNAYGSGVRFAATVHCRDMNELLNRQAVKSLLSAGVFDGAVFLDCTEKGRIRDIRRLNDVR